MVAGEGSGNSRTGTTPIVVVFDVDDTLYLEADFVRSGFASVDDHLRVRYGALGFLEASWALFRQGRRGDIFDAAMPEIGLEASPALVPELVAVYRDHRPDITLAEDARRALEWAAGLGGCAALTDGYAVTQLRKVEALGLPHYCTPIVRTDVWGRAYWKPHQRGFEQIQDHFGLPGEAFVYIGDNPGKDFIGPRGLGWKTIRIRRPGGLHAEMGMTQGQHADRTIADLDELLEGEMAGWLQSGHARS